MNLNIKIVIALLLNSNSKKLFDIFQELNIRNIELKTLNEAKEETTNTLQSLEKEMSALKEEKVNIMESENIFKLQLLESKKECEGVKSEMNSHKEQNNGSDVINSLQEQLVEIRKECEDAKRSIEIGTQEKLELEVEYSNMKKEMQVIHQEELATVQGDNIQIMKDIIQQPSNKLETSFIYVGNCTYFYCNLINIII
jgi:chromosome segregation ATPase